MGMKVAWNRDKTSSVLLAKLKEYTLFEQPDGKWSVYGWFNKENHFNFGTFDTKPQAEKFLQNIFDRM